MIELFTDISDQVKDQTKFWVNLALLQSSALEADRIIKNYIESLTNENERNFVQFYLRMKMEQLLDESMFN